MASKLGQNGRLYLEQHFDRAALAVRLAQVMEDMVYKV
jgi:hypothetical protein